ncbi:PilZ domain-containing protein [Paenibacillus sepulcri]|uniref:PilZ domain-containing protein n=1 Tax=Paenibacillus sepulcri TaxID=359917 RepID=A0ABS7C7Q7_9BACL|nr:PilZ domain-containing protein [Paenibacillus sepulcri]
MSTNARSKELYTKAKQTYSDKVLIHSRTVVEKEGYVSTGILSHIEGEMMEIEMTEYKSFDLGNPVEMTIYSPVGIQRLQSTVIGKAEGSIAVIFPVRALSGLEEKRESPRVQIDHKGTMKKTIIETRELSTGPENFEFIEDMELAIRNISLSGLGFIVAEGPRLKTNERLEAVLSLGFELPCWLEIIRYDSDGAQSFYGARFCDLDGLQQRALRAFILREQVAAYYRRKQEKASDNRTH